MPLKKYTFRNMPKNIKEKLPDLRKKVIYARDADSKNFEYFNKYKRFIFDTTLTESIQSKLLTIKRPMIEVNELAQFIDTQMGEWKNFEPSISITPSPDITDADYIKKQEKTVEILQGYIRHLLSPSSNNFDSFNLMKDIFAGGMSAAQVKIDYNSDGPMDFKLKIFVDKKIYPTMCGWDPHAIEDTRIDGDYCFEISSYTKSQLTKKHGEEILKYITPCNTVEGFSWSFTTKQEDYYVVCEFYEKNTKRIHSVMLSDNRTMKYSDYKKMIDNWDQPFQIPPVPIQHKRSGVETTIWKYTFTENIILDAEETIYKYLPIARAQGGNERFDSADGRSKEDKIRSLMHNLIGLQTLKNTAAQSLAFRLENMISANLIIEKSTIIPNQMEALINNQIPRAIVYDGFPMRSTGNGDRQPPPPQIVAPPDIPPVIAATMQSTSTEMRKALGMLESNNVPGGNISSQTLRTAYSQETRVVSPWIKGFNEVINWIGIQLMDLIPKVFTTPTTIPIIKESGERTFIQLNQPGNPDSVMMDFNPKDFNISITCGANAEILKQISMQQITELAHVFPSFAKFVDQKQMPALIEMLDIKNKAAWVSAAQEWQENQVEATKNTPPPTDPVKAQLQMASMIEQGKDKDRQLEAAKIAAEIQNDNRKTDASILKTMSQVKTESISASVRQQEADAKNLHSAVSLVSSLAKQKSDSREVFHKMAHEHSLKDKDHAHKLEIAEISKKDLADNDFEDKSIASKPENQDN